MNASIPSWEWPRDATGEILVGGQPLTRVVEAVGSTPCYVYDRSRLAERAQGLRAVLPEAVLLHYAMKANPMPALVCHMAGLVDGIDVASAGELRVALDTGMSPQHISFAGPGKSDNELRQAAAAGILVNVESFREIKALADAGQRSGVPARVAVRVNLPFELKASGMKMSGGARQFGVDAERVPELLREIAGAGLAFEGFHMFAGSQNLRHAAIVEAQGKCYEQALEWQDLLPAPIRSLNLGGGFGIPYSPGETSLDASPVIDNLARLSDRLVGDFPGAHIVIELGRYLVGEAGIYVARVIDRKISRGQVFLVVDGGMHHHLAASGNFGQVIRRNYPVAVNGRRGERETANVVGPLCTPLDLLADRMELDVAEPGDLVVVFQSGAYGHSASPRAFLSHPEAVEALV
ncbi:MAG: pyridoxal-dependent decarboxylase, exosortase A system-associated [Xanthomonas sp.]|jgi:diaminopimelate decarboxylase|uniref:pyridoxal-dependent decarboxylase, exosortase A system-associated n=1 Tax=Pseudoxanthomonas mexicana TaxID=128785 RepID=UPI0007829473|nr:pyridoxal-dependent decarboxylase, exosortase A system-associated [Pseudoxanthomonas mexicana]MBA3930123.1 pyridoxal-dependent decarboxylase, exosortase A system-associated [Xanthomonas sp.]MBL8255057.1 pyridoxal-dependent decarboxylase, exosortase A system-associated [Pseudoxanthomonas mexicana]